MVIPENELLYSFSRSSGKGGQNVNKTSTRVQLRWNPNNSVFLPPENKKYLIEKLKNQLTNEGDIIVVCDEERSQFANLRKATHKLTLLVQTALKRPKKRLKTNPTHGSRLKRLEGKRKISVKKKNRKILEF